VNPLILQWGGRWLTRARLGLVGLTLIGPSAVLAFDDVRPVETTGEALPLAVARHEGAAVPGRRVLLKGNQSTGSGLHYRWTQTQGLTVDLDRAGSSEASFIVPEGEAPLGFSLVVGNKLGLSSASLTIPMASTPATGRGTRRDLALRAITDGDRSGRVGRPVMLDGSKSEPKGRVAYRWIQANGPPVTKKLVDGGVYTFFPPQPGTYQFALVVAGSDQISEPSYHTVEIGPAESGPTESLPSSAVPVSMRTPTPAPDPTSEMARRALQAIPDGPDRAEELARVFEDVSTRMDVYESYQDAHSEMARRLDQLIPKEEPSRSEWIARVFNPLTLRMIEAVKVEGLDLARPSAQKSRLKPGARKILADHFHAMADGFGRAGDPSSVSQRLDGRTAR